MNTLHSRYDLKKKIGQGSFGELWLSFDRTAEETVAVKLEKLSCATPQLEHEAKVLRRLQGGPGLPQVREAGETEDCRYLVMTLLGPSLDELCVSMGGRLSLKSAVMIGDQVLCRLHYIHSKHYLHRDIKPANLLMGLGASQSLVHVVDFGLAKKYRDPVTGTHIPYCDGKGLAGTSRYTSVNTHVGIEQSRRDDIEGLSYVLVYLLKGNLPWQGLHVRTKHERNQRIMETKLSLNPRDLCKGLPSEMCTLLEYSRSLAFEQAPDYTFLRRLLKDLLTRMGLSYDHHFDWTGTAAYHLLETEKTVESTENAEDTETEVSRCVLA